jgi:hypothetical protein
MAGHDLEIDRPKFVSLEITMLAHLKPGYFRRDVRAAVLRLFSRQGLFHPDNFTFGQTVFLSPLLAAAQAVEGVDFVEITTFQRMDVPGTEGLDDAKLVFSRLEIPRLDNNPNFPDRGVFNLTLEGGK